MKTILPLAFSALLASTLLTSCFTPREVVRIAPAKSENVFWHQGQAIAEAQQDSIVARAAFSHADREYFFFDVEFFNDSSEPCLISPEKMTLVTDNNFQIRATDPERLLFAQEMDASRREARAKNWAVAGGVALTTAAVIAATSSDGGGNDSNGEYNYDAVDASVDIAQGVSMVAWGVSFRQDPILSVNPSVLPSSADMIFWQDVALRRTTLMPGEQIRGLVGFVRETEESGLTLDMTTECTHFSFRFEQRLFQP